ncbi:MAG: hypothetical protein ACYTFK_11110 [Planctomycetota bacterium]
MIEKKQTSWDRLAKYGNYASRIQNPAPTGRDPEGSGLHFVQFRCDQHRESDPALTPGLCGKSINHFTGNPKTGACPKIHQNPIDFRRIQGYTELLWNMRLTGVGGGGKRSENSLGKR